MIVSTPSPSRYNYSQAARQIVAGCDTKYKQAYAIYRWLCDNISYDTTLRINTADECWDTRRGVCQAYSELFYRLGEAIGLKSYIVGGVGRTPDGRIESHAWIFAIVEDNSAGIMIDPTWGAGAVKGGVFTHSINDDTWFNVDPRWLIFSHYPRDERLQLLPQPISRAQFDALPATVLPLLGKYGFDAKKIFDRCMAGKTDFPTFFNSGAGVLRLVEVPLQSTLRVGVHYRFAVQKLQPCELALVNNGTFFRDWQVQGNIYHYDFVPIAGGNLSLTFNQGSGRTFNGAVQYNVAQPTAGDVAKAAQSNPLAMPEITRLANYNAAMLNKYDIDGVMLYAAVRRGEVTALPQFYSTAGSCVIDAMPFNHTLRVGRSYTFTLRPNNGIEWAVINGGDWYKTWRHTSGGAISMAVTPRNTGQLVLAVQMQQGGSFEFCVGYDVVM